MPSRRAPMGHVPATRGEVPAPRGHVPAPRGHVVVVGSLNLDHVVTVERLPKPGETVSGRGYLAVPGGKGLNQAVTSARQGAEVAMVGCVGDDPPGRRLLQVLADEGISAEYARTVPGVPSGTALITVASDGANTIVVAPGANHELGPADVDRAGACFHPGSVVLGQLEVPLAAAQAAFALARARRATTLLNPAPASAGLSRELLGLVDVVLPNETEALAISGRGTPEEAASWFVDQGCSAAVVTLGELGALVARRGEKPAMVAAHKVEAVDTTAAGDAFCGALAAALASGASLFEGVRAGSAAGALAATVMGALPSLPTAVETRRLLGAVL